MVRFYPEREVYDDQGDLGVLVNMRNGEAERKGREMVSRKVGSPAKSQRHSSSAFRDVQFLRCLLPVVSWRRNPMASQNLEEWENMPCVRES